MKKWVFIKYQILDANHFNLFYIEHVPSGQYRVFGEDIHQICWNLGNFETAEDANAMLESISRQINGF